MMTLYCVLTALMPFEAVLFERIISGTWHNSGIALYTAGVTMLIVPVIAYMFAKVLARDSTDASRLFSAFLPQIAGIGLIAIPATLYFS